MAAYLVLIVAALSRCLPHWMHTSGMGVTATGAGLLFFGSRIRSGRWQALAAAAIMAVTDYYLTVYAYGFPFRASGYITTWAWYAGIALFGSAVLSQKRTALRVGGSAIFSAISFFLLSNGEVWLTGRMYPHTLSGLGASYVAGLPFYRNDLVSTLLISATLFGIPALAREMAKMLEDITGQKPVA